MAVDVADRVGGSFDDIPDAELRTVLAIPIQLPPVPAAAPATREVAPSATHRQPRSSRATGLLETLSVGLGAAVTVFVVVAVVLLVVHLVLD